MPDPIDALREALRRYDSFTPTSIGIHTIIAWQEARDDVIVAARALLAEAPQPRQPKVGDRVAWQGLADTYFATVEYVQPLPPLIGLRWEHSGGSMQCKANEVTPAPLPPVEVGGAPEGDER